jgi:hypothetical protein
MYYCILSSVLLEYNTCMIIEAEVRGGVIWVAAQLGTVASSRSRR